jgi:Protein of unknown function (DUF2948)
VRRTSNIEVLHWGAVRVIAKATAQAAGIWTGLQRSDICWPMPPPDRGPWNRTMSGLKLIALDQEDLAILAANLQDAIGIVSEMTYLPRERRFVALLNRFDWVSAVADPKAPPRRRKAALRIERVLGAKVQGIDLRAKADVVSVLTVQFDAIAGRDEPAGQITLVCAGGKALRFDVECIEVQIEDLEAAWTVQHAPRHDV